MCSQALISHASLGAPDAVDAVTAQHSDWVSTFRCSCGETKLSFVALRDSVCKTILRNGIDFAKVFQDYGICTLFVKRGTTFNGLKSNYACVVCEECVNPPAVTKPSARKLRNTPSMLTPELGNLDHPVCEILWGAVSQDMSLTTVSRVPENIISDVHGFETSWTYLL